MKGWQMGWIREAVRSRLARVDWGDVGTRAVRTFAQAGVPAIAVAALPAFQSGDYRGAWALAIPPAAAGLSVVWNTIVRPAVREVLA